MLCVCAEFAAWWKECCDAAAAERGNQDAAVEVAELESLADAKLRDSLAQKCAPRRIVARAAADAALPRVRVRRRNEKPAIPDDADLFGPSRTAATFDDHILQIDIIGTDALRPDRYVSVCRRRRRRGAS